MELYKDQLITVATPEQPATKGHVTITLQKPYESLTQEDFAHALSAASFLSNVLFEQGGAQGTNIIFSDLEGSVFDVLTRQEEDNLSFQWEPLAIEQEALKKIGDNIKDKCDYIGVQTQEAPQQKEEVTPEEPEEPIETKKTVNYLLKKLDRIP